MFVRKYYRLSLICFAHPFGCGVIDYLNMTDAGTTIAAALDIKLRDATGQAVNLQTRKKQKPSALFVKILLFMKDAYGSMANSYLISPRLPTKVFSIK